MNICTIFRSKKYGPIQKVMLYLSLIGAGLLVFVPVAWAYHKIQMGVGVEVAQTVLAFEVAFLLVLTFTGFALGYLMDWAIRHRRFVFHAPQQGGWIETLIRLWGYELNCCDQAGEFPASFSDKSQNKDEILALINRPRRRGRKPTFSIDQWKRVVLKWENRDPLRDTFTLSELLAEQFGTYADGSPRMADQSYYAWRDRVLVELQQEAGKKRSNCGEGNQK